MSYFNAGRSLDLWRIDEQITAEKLNNNERKYGGVYHELSYQISTGTVLFSSYAGINVFGSGGEYGYLTYGTALFNQVNDSCEIMDYNPTFEIGNDFVYGTGVYGFISYGV